MPGKAHPLFRSDVQVEGVCGGGRKRRRCAAEGKRAPHAASGGTGRRPGYNRVTAAYRSLATYRRRVRGKFRLPAATVRRLGLGWMV